MTSFAVDPATAKLTEISVQPSQGAAPCHLVLDRTGRYLAVANYSGGNYALFPVGADGRLQPATSVVDGKSDTPRRNHWAIWWASTPATDSWSPLTKGWTGCWCIGSTRQRVPDANQPPAAALPPGSGPRHFEFHPNGRWLFTISEQAATITTFSWNGKSGSLTALGSVPTRPAGFDTGTTAEIAVHPNGRFVYGSNRGHDSIAVFRVGARRCADPRRTRVDARSDATELRARPSGRWLIAANQRSNTLAVFSDRPDERRVVARRAADQRRFARQHPLHGTPVAQAFRPACTAGRAKALRYGRVNSYRSVFQACNIPNLTNVEIQDLTPTIN